MCSSHPGISIDLQLPTMSVAVALSALGASTFVYKTSYNSTMQWFQRLNQLLEHRWVAPAYAGYVLIGFSLCFWLAAMNTLGGWLYVLSGTMVALLGVAAILPARSLRSLSLSRGPIYPVRAGEPLTLTLHLHNGSKIPQALIEVQDHPPERFGIPAAFTIEQAPGRGQITWTTTLIPQQRGLYRWTTVTLRTAAPLGLFWAKRQRTVPAIATVYPQVLPLSHCPVLDAFAADLQSTLPRAFSAVNQGSDGTTRSVRPYRAGDPMRLIHWRSSARLGTLHTRELEVFTADSPVTLALDSEFGWDDGAFEQAVIAAASLYAYAIQRAIAVQLWSPTQGRLTSMTAVMEALALVQIGETGSHPYPEQPLLWLSQNPGSLAQLPLGSRSLLWVSEQLEQSAGVNAFAQPPELRITLEQPLQPQLQRS
jgi:uncharacterized protein (DUF58 family)